jgi:stage II sporulation protein D
VKRARWLAVSGLVLACTTPVTPTPVVTTIPVYRPPPTPSASAPPGDTRSQPRAPVIDPSTGRLVRDAGDTTIRVLLSVVRTTATVASPTGFLITDRRGTTVAHALPSAAWRVEADGRRVRAIRSDGVPTVWLDAELRIRPMESGLLSVGGKPYRGDLVVAGSDSGAMLVNVLRIDDYLLGVVPLEIGTRATADSAAVQAQAVTARSYAYIHLAGNPFAMYDVTSGTQDQVYGGVGAETAVASQAVESTRTLVLKYAGRVVNAPYSSTCGGSTAAASEIWRSNDEPYLQRVSDQIPGTGRYYCDISPRFRWTRTIEGAELNAALARYLASYTRVPPKGPGIVQNVTVGGHTPSGRVSTVTITTARGNFVVRGNDIRYVFRAPGGEILNSTYFSALATQDAGGALERLTLNGNGYGHGVGMCQWGAIGRARAGQDFRTILRTYYPGTTVGAADERG